jgi:putative ABC transport system permease protein
MKFSEFIENIKLAFEAMRANKLRSFLASLGVLVGISTVILMGWLLSGLNDVVDDTFDMLGVDVMYIDKWDWTGGENWKITRYRKNISMQEYEEFKDRMNVAEVVVPIIRSWNSEVSYKNENFQGISIVGTTAEHVQMPAGTLKEGRHITPYEEFVGADVIVIGSNVHEIIFKNGKAIGEIIKINGRKYEVVGIIKEQGTFIFDQIDNQCFIPVKAFYKTFGTSRRSVSIAVKAGNEERLDYVRSETIGLMRTIRNVAPEEKPDFSINESKAFEDSIAEIRLYVWASGIGITLLSFIVGVIGIMNIMFVSVTERTKEIGIRKSIGAKKSSILTQFIVESSALCFIGAILSFILTSAIVFGVATVLPKFIPKTSFLRPYMSLELLGLATVVSIVVGILAGLIPAIRASNLNPVDALRFE